MKATELIRELKTRVKRRGDFNVACYDERGFKSKAGTIRKLRKTEKDEFTFSDKDYYLIDE